MKEEHARIIKERKKEALEEKIFEKAAVTAQHSDSYGTKMNRSDPTEARVYGYYAHDLRVINRVNDTPLHECNEITIVAYYDEGEVLRRIVYEAHMLDIRDPKKKHIEVTCYIPGDWKAKLENYHKKAEKIEQEKLRLKEIEKNMLEKKDELEERCKFGLIRKKEAKEAFKNLLQEIQELINQGIENEREPNVDQKMEDLLTNYTIHHLHRVKSKIYQEMEKVIGNHTK